MRRFHSRRSCWPQTAMADDVPKRLSVSDLSVETQKWDEKLVQTTAHCFYADKDKYRCGIGVAGAVFVRVDFSEIEPETMKKTIEENCDTVEKMFSRPCAVQITFTYAGNDREEKMDGSIMMMIIAKDGKGALAKTK